MSLKDISLLERDTGHILKCPDLHALDLDPTVDKQKACLELWEANV